MSAIARALPTLFRVGFADIVSYRAELTIWVLSATLPLVMLALWNAVAADGPVAGFGQVELARYFAATLIVRQLTGAWIVWQLNHLIRTGALSPMLLRPMNPLVYEATTMITALPFRLIVLAPLLAGLLWWRPELWASPGWASFGLFLVSTLLAWVLSFLVQAAFGLLSFWVDQSVGLFGLWFAAWGLLSGYVAPTALFPESVRPILDWLPFRGMLGVPVELLGGFLTWREALPEIGVQLMWVAVFGAIVATLWRRGVRRYGAFGA